MLNVCKCGVIIRQSASTVAFPNFCWTDSIEACLLGVPLFPGQALTTALEENQQSLKEPSVDLDLCPLMAFSFLYGRHSARRG
jgi:hypothetical protein